MQCNLLGGCGELYHIILNILFCHMSIYNLKHKVSAFFHLWLLSENFSNMVELACMFVFFCLRCNLLVLFCFPSVLRSSETPEYCQRASPNWRGLRETTQSPRPGIAFLSYASLYLLLALCEVFLLSCLNFCRLVVLVLLAIEITADLD